MPLSNAFTEVPTMQARVMIYEGAEAVEVATAAELEHVLHLAAKEARRRGMLNVIYVEAANCNTLSVVVGGDETVLGFTYSHGNPPYFESRGPSLDDEPVLTGYVHLSHHTEFPRRCVIPMEIGVSAAKEFMDSGRLPTCVSWAET
jgi:hypothetical protein